MLSMKKLLSLLLALSLVLAGCGTPPAETTAPEVTEINGATQNGDGENVTHISLDGADVYVEEGSGVYTDHDIVYYEAGHDFTYGEGLSADEHTREEANAHTVIHITRPGTYRISGTMPAGQIAVDLGEDAKDDPEAVVTLILDGVDMMCRVAPAIIFYNVYECGSDDPDTAGAVVDTSRAGANVVIADGSVNTVNGSYVAKIYKPDSVVLSEDGTEVADAKKLHKYDAALYSRMSMNIWGGETGDGKLTINAENEGLGTELHLTVNGGNITINSGNDGINTNEDGVSVTTVNAGHLTVNVLGTTGEGDGIDSNGWLVINGGTVEAYAHGFSADGGIDSDMGIHLNGGTVIAAGQMLDPIAEGDATYAVFRFSGTLPGGTTLTLKNGMGDPVMECTPVNDFSVLILSGEALEPGTYTFWMGDIQLTGTAGMTGPGFPGGMEGNMGAPGQMPGQFEGEPPEGDYQIPPQPQPGGDLTTQGTRSGDTPVSEDPDVEPMPGGPFGPGGLAGMNPPDMPMDPIESRPPEGDYEIPPQPGINPVPQGGESGTFPDRNPSTEFVIAQGGNYFSNVGAAQYTVMPIV